MNAPLTRRSFLACAAGAVFSAHPSLRHRCEKLWLTPYQSILKEERARVMKAADAYLAERPNTITSVRASRSAGGIHDYYSEGDYWWPDPKDPKGPYIRRDGMSNPDNFVAHRDLLIRFSIQMPALVAAWLVTGDRQYAQHASAHLHAWFVDPKSHMNPNLEFAQAIHGRDTGRSIGIIDTVQLVEVAQAARVLQHGNAIDIATSMGTKRWFQEYLHWLTTSNSGKQERDKRNNHGSCWLLQAGEFAVYTGQSAVRRDCRERFKNILIPEQVALNGSFPLELARTKPYNYSTFNLNILGMCAQALSDERGDLWTYTLNDGRCLRKAFEFLTPYIANKSLWPYRHDVECYNDLPVREPALLFAGLAYRSCRYISVWEKLNPDPIVPEIIRNHPIRQPLLWISESSKLP